MPITDYYVTTDAMGSVMAVLDESGNVLERRSYDAFGEATYMLADGTVVPDSPTGVDIGFQGQLMDELTGMYQMGFRWYSPLLGRWVSRDPIGLLGGANASAFVGNYPVGGFDLNGLAPLEFGDPAYISDQIRRGELLRNDTPKARCMRMRRARLAEVEKIASARSSAPINCNASQECELVSVLISIADPCADFLEKFSGHAGIGVGNDFYDFGPIDDARLYEKGSQWWDRPGFSRWDGKPPGKSPAEINLSDIVRKITTISYEPVVLIEYCACKKEADSIRGYWDKLYGKINSTGVTWSPVGLSCTSAVCESMTGSRHVITPDDLLDLLSARLVSTCGASAGRPASISLLTRTFKG